MSEPVQGLFGKLLKRPHLAGFAFELQTRLPSLEAAEALSIADLTEMCARHRVRSLEEVGAVALPILVSRAMGATRGELTSKQTGVLLSLAGRFGIEKASIRSVLMQAATGILKSDYEALIARGPIDPADFEKLKASAREIGLVEHEIERTINEVVGPKIQSRVAAALTDGRLRPDDEASIHRLAAELGVGFSVTGDAAVQFEEARTRWAISQGRLPVVDCPLMLKRGETCHGWVNASAMESRERTVGRGQYRYREAYAHTLGEGPLVVTDSRIIFSSGTKSLNYRIDSIIDWNFYVDGLEVRRATGKPIVFVFGTGQEVFQDVIVAVRGRALAD